jgi:hypothetical protein
MAFLMSGRRREGSRTANDPLHRGDRMACDAHRRQQNSRAFSEGHHAAAGRCKGDEAAREKAGSLTTFHLRRIIIRLRRSGECDAHVERYPRADTLAHIYWSAHCVHSISCQTQWSDLPLSNSVSIIRIIIPRCHEPLQSLDRRVGYGEDYSRMHYDQAVLSRRYK